MKPMSAAIYLAASIYIFGLAGPATAQNGGPYTVTHSSFDGSVGQASGGAYQLTAMIGQPDTGSLEGGPYTLRGGVGEVGPLSQGPFRPVTAIYLPLIVKQ